MRLAEESRRSQEYIKLRSKILAPGGGILSSHWLRYSRPITSPGSPSAARGAARRRTMKRLWTLLGGVGMIVASGAIASAQADDDKRSVTVYTPSLAGNHFTCKAVNVSHKPLRIPFAVLDNNGD